MITIYKYPFAVTDLFTLELPLHAKILTVQVQENVPCLWALVNVTPGMALEPRTFRIFGTGQSITTSEISLLNPYVGTFQLQGGAPAFHVFEV